MGGLALGHAYWHHIALTVFEEDAAFFVNGSVVGVSSLAGPIMDDSSSGVTLGQMSTGEINNNNNNNCFFKLFFNCYL